MFDTFADHIIKSQQVAGRDTFAVRRVGYHDTRLRGIGILLEGQCLQVDVFNESGTAYVLLCDLDSSRVDIRSVTFESELAFIAFIVVDTVEQFLVEIDPFLESKFLAVDTRGDVERDHSRFDQQGSRTTHGIDEV